MKKWLILGLILIILALIGWAFWVISRPQPLTKQETDQAIEQILGRPVREVAETPDFLSYEGQYFRISYPGTAKVYPLPSQNSIPDNQLESFSLDVPNPKRVVTVIISKGSDLTDLSGYQYRQSSSSGYLHQQQSIKDKKIHSFTKPEPNSEVTAFLQKGNLLMSLSVTGRQSKEVQELYDQLINQLDWSSTNK